MKNVGLLYGGRSNEWEISVITAVQVMNNARGDYIIIPLFMKDGEIIIPKHPKQFSAYTQKIQGKKAVFSKGGIKVGGKILPLDCVILANHGGEGEDGTMQSILSYFQIPYCTAKAESMSLCMNKYLFKQYLKGINIPYVEGEKIQRGETPSFFPCILKPNHLGSSIGVQVVNTYADFQEKSEISFAFDEEILAEKFLLDFEEYSIASIYDGEEIILSDIEKEISTDRIFTFSEKYQNDNTVREIPARIEESREVKIKNIVEKVVKDLSLFGVVRTDFLYDKSENKLYVNEINTIPGSFAYKLFMGKGITLNKLINKLVEIGKKKQDKVSYFSTGILSSYTTGGKK